MFISTRLFFLLLKFSVEHTINELCTSKSSHTTTPMDVTIISNDVAFFTDTNIETHKRALTRLWDRLKTKFQSNAIRSVNIVIFETKVDALKGPNNCTNIENDDSEEISEISSSAAPQKFKIAFCVREVQNHIQKLLEKEFKQPMRMEGKSGMQMNLRLEFKEFNTISFLSIMQEWSQNVLNSASSNVGRICFELPETFDGTQSAITLDLKYSICPYRLDSLMTRILLDKLKELSESSIEVVQLVPLDSIDLSFIYGTPISVKAGIEGDLDHYKHMQVLVSLLFDYLGSRDFALVLKSYREAEPNNSKLFLLMAEVETVGVDGHSETSKSKFVAKGQGMLYHYVDKLEYIIEEDQNDGNIHQNNDDEMTKFSSDYIENSLSLLDCSELTPSYSLQQRNQSK